MRYTTLALVALMAGRLYCGGVSPRLEYEVEPYRSSFLSFGQSLALADFDGDHCLDQARLVGNGRNKNVEIRLTQANAPTVLHFDTLTTDRGSLFAKDIDNDGDNDLIWTDLIHPDDVVIWLDDGSGRFERLCPDPYAEEFVISDGPAVDGSETPHPDFAFSSRHDPSHESATAHDPAGAVRTSIFSSASRVRGQTGVLGTPSDRGPPSLL